MNELSPWDDDPLDSAAQSTPTDSGPMPWDADPIEPRRNASPGRRMVRPIEGFDAPEEYGPEQPPRYEDMSVPARARAQLTAGLHGMDASTSMPALSATSRILQQMDRIDAGGALDPNDPESGPVQAYRMSDPATRQRTRGVFEQQLGRSITHIINAQARQQAQPRNPRAEEITRAGNEGRWGDAWRIFRDDPAGIIQQFTVESIPASAAMMVPGVGAAAAGAGRVGTGIAAYLGSAGTEFGSQQLDALNDALQRAGVDANDPAAMQAWVRANPDALREMVNAAARGMNGPAIFDALTLGFGRGIVPGRGVLRNTGRVGANFAAESAGEPAGAALGQVLAEGDVNKPGDLIGEFLGGVGQVGPTTAAGTIQEMREARAAGALPVQPPAPQPAPVPAPQTPQAGPTTPAPAAPPAAPASAAAPSPPPPVAPAASSPADGVTAGAAAPIPEAPAPGAAAVPPAAPAEAAAGATHPPAPAAPSPLSSPSLLPPAPPPANTGRADLEAILDDPRPAAQIEADRATERAAGISALQQGLPQGWSVVDEDGAISVLDPNGEWAFQWDTPPADPTQTLAEARQMHDEGLRSGLYGEAVREGDGTRAAPVQAQNPGDVDAAATQATQPTPAQAQAGNYAKGHLRLHGLDLAIETPRGGTRSGVGADGRPWSVQMPAHYGEVKRTEGADGDPVDVYLGPQAEDAGMPVFVVDQIDPDTGRFDEHKAMLGFSSDAEAVAAYNAAFNDDSGPRRRGAITRMSLDEFKAWLHSAQRGPVARESIKAGVQIRRAEKARQRAAEKAAKAPKPQPQEKWRPIGVNAKGMPLFEDEDGVRSYTERGLRMTETVGLRPTRAGGWEATIDKSQRGRDWSTAEEWQAQQPQAPAPTPEPEEDPAGSVEIVEGVAEANGINLSQQEIHQAAALVDGGMSPKAAILQVTEAAAIEAEQDAASAAEPGSPWREVAFLPTDRQEQADMLGGPARGRAEMDAAGPMTAEQILDLPYAEGTYMRAQAEESIRAMPPAERARVIADLAEIITNQPDIFPGRDESVYLTWLDMKIRPLAPKETTKRDTRAAGEAGEAGAGEGGAPAETDGQGAAGTPPPGDEPRAGGADTGPAPAPVAAPNPSDETAKSDTPPKRIVSDDRMEELKKRLRAKLTGQLNSGIDPEILTLGGELAVGYLERGARRFGEWAAQVVADIGEGVRPYLRGWYEGSRYYPGFDPAGMTPVAEMDAAVAAFEAGNAKDGSDVDAGTGEKDQVGGPPTEARPGSDPEQRPASPDTGDLGAGQPEDVGKPKGGRRGGRGGISGAAANVGGAGAPDRDGGASDGRPGGSGEGAPAAGTGDGGSGGVATPSAATVTADADTRPPAEPSAGNFHMENPLEIVGGGPVARFNRNRDAIALYNVISETGRNATADEQRILAGYTGWGSFGQELFKGNWARPMPKAGWEERDAWLRQHMGREQWESAQRSITNAHYTDPPTVLAMWDMVRRMGFEGGRVLEPSMGIGNFFAMMPREIKDRSRLNGIEMDQTTGGMAKLLYPDANVRVMPYQQSRTPDNFYDVVIGNWPFEDTVIADRRYNALSPFLHDYFFLKAMDQVRPGGLVVGITSSGTMDKAATRIRATLAKQAELLAAIRLPTGAFEEYAGTAVITDIIVLRKRPEPLSQVPDDAWIEAADYRTPSGQTVRLNRYYHQNPNHVLGVVNYGSHTTIGRPGMVVDRPDNMAERLREAVNLVPEGAYRRDQTTRRISYVSNHTADREGALTFQDGKPHIVRGEQLAPANDVQRYVTSDAAATAKREDQFRALIDMRRAYAALIEAERTGQPTTELRPALRQQYEAFTKKHGLLADSYGLDYLRKIDDPFYPALAALEHNGKPATILERSTMRGRPDIENPSIEDAYVLARNIATSPSLREIAEIAKKPEAEVKARLVETGAVFETPTGDIVPSDLYLSGNVRAKLREARAAVEDEGMEHLKRNITALEAVQPKDVPFYQIETQMGATWVSPATYADYIAHMLNQRSSEGIDVTFINGRWKIRIPARMKNLGETRAGYGTSYYPFQKLVNAAISNQTVTIKYEDTDGKVHVDTAATAETNARIEKIRTDFGQWLWGDPVRRVEMEREYNEARNAYATPKYDGSFMQMPGMALTVGRGPFNLRKHQIDAIWRAILNRRSLNAHEVGTGKTFTMGGIAVESRRYGIAKKPLILAHNANSKSVAHEIQSMYPAANVLYIDNLSPDQVNTRLRQIANDDWDAIVMPHSLIDRLAMRQDTLMAMAKEEIEALEEEAIQAAIDDGATLLVEDMDDPDVMKKVRSPTAKDLVKARNRIIETIQKQAQRASKEGAIAFEDLGVDMILVDEAHEFKKPPIATRMRMKGLNTQTSGRSIQLQFLTSYIRAQNNGGNVHLFTGTPVTNTLTEVFHQMRYVMKEEMKAAGMDNWDGWFGSFAKEVQDVELSAAAEYESVVRLAGFINVPELKRMIGQYMDVVFADDMPEMKPRATADGKTMASPDLTEAERAKLLNGRTEGAIGRPYKKVVNVSSDLTPAQKVMFERLQGYARAWRSMSGKEKRDAMIAGAPESPIITEQMANKASFDVRLVNGERLAGQEGKAEDDPGSKASNVVRNVMEIYRSHPLATQVIFSEQGFGKSVTRSMGRDASGTKRTRKVATFSTIADIVERLKAEGIPASEIAVVDGSTSKDRRKEIADAMNEATIRVVIGSTDTLGVGVNMQRNLRAMHHLDAPYMPGELEQRNGRGLRQGNQWNTVLEYRYMTDRLDGRRWQILAIKARFIREFLTASDTSRVIEGEAAEEEQSDILESFSQAAGDPRILIREKLRKKIEKLQASERLHGEAQADAVRQGEYAEQQAQELRGRIREAEQRVLPLLAKFVEAQAGDGFRAVIEGQPWAERKDAQAALDAAIEEHGRIKMEPREIGTIGGETLTMSWGALANQPTISVTIGGREFEAKSIAGLEMVVRSFPAQVDRWRAAVAQQESTIERMRETAESEFPRAAEMRATQKRLDALMEDIAANPVPPPAWLRNGAPVESAAYRNGREFIVAGHRWSSDGWFVLAEDSKGQTLIPYMEVTDSHGIPLYEERPFEPPAGVEDKTRGAAATAAAPAKEAVEETRESEVAAAAHIPVDWDVESGRGLGPVLYANPFDPALFNRLVWQPLREALGGSTALNGLAAKIGGLHRDALGRIFRDPPLPPNSTIENRAEAQDVTALARWFKTPERMFAKWPALARLVQDGMRAEQRAGVWRKRLTDEYEAIRTTLRREKGDWQKVAEALYLADAEAVDLDSTEAAREFFEEQGLSPVEAKATAALHRLLMKQGRLVDQHRRAMMPVIRARKAEIWRRMERVLNSAGVDSKAYQTKYRRRAYLNARIKAGKGDLAAQAAERDALTAELREIRTNDPEIRAEHDALREDYDALEARLADTSIRNRIKGYFPHKFYGSWRLYRIEKDADGKDQRVEITSDQGFYDSRGEAIAAARAYAAEHPGARLHIEPRKVSFPEALSGTPVTDANFRRISEGLAEEAALSPDEVRAVLKGKLRRRSRRRVLSAAMKRAGAEGFAGAKEGTEAEMADRVLRTHINQIVRYVTMDRLKAQYVNTTERMGLSPGRLNSIQREGRLQQFNALEAWWRDVNGAKQGFEQVLDGALQRMGLPGSTLAAAASGAAVGGLVSPYIAPVLAGYAGYRMYRAMTKGGEFPTRAVIGGIVGDMAHLKLGMLVNIGSALVNLTQTMVNTFPLLGAKWTAEGAKRAAEAMWSMSRNRDNPGRMSEDAHILRRLDVVTDQRYTEENEIVRPALSAARRLSMFWFERAERVNRATAALGAYHRALDRGATPGAAFEEARRLMTRTQFHQGTANRPELLRQQWARIPTQFQNFMYQQIAFAFGLRGKAEISRFLIALLLVAGFLGLPGLQILDWLLGMVMDQPPMLMARLWAIDRAAGSTEAMTAAQVLLRGLPALGGVDISGRVGMGKGFGPDRPSDLAGPTIGSLIRLAELTRREAPILEQLGAVSPAANQAREAAGLVGGGARTSGMRRGYVEDQPTTGERVRALVGLRPVTRSVETDVREGQREATEDRRRSVDRYIARIVQAVQDDRPERIQEVRRQAAEAGIRLTQRQIVDAVRDSRRTRAERDIRRAPREIRPDVANRQRAVEEFRGTGP